MKSFWQDNLAALRQYHPNLFHRISSSKCELAGQIVSTPSGLPTLRFTTLDGSELFAYSVQSPMQDTAVHLQTIEQGSRGLALFVGMGLGYGPLRVLEERPTLGMMIIMEPSLDLFVTALQCVDLQSLIRADKVHWFVGEIDFGVFENLVARIAALEDTHILRHVVSFQWRREVYKLCNQKAFNVVNQLNTTGGTTRKAGEHFFRNRLANLSLLRHSNDLGMLKDLFRNMPAILAAAGPSLDNSLEALKETSGRCVLFAVDSALAPLLKAGIMPDFVTSLDFQEMNFEKLAPFVGKSWPFSLICSPKTTPLIPKRFQAHRLFWTFNEDIPQQWMIDSLGIKDLIPATFSVAHLSLGAALLMGCNPIVLLGQDLAYSSGEGDHAAGTVLMGHGLPKNREIFYVPGINGKQVPTDRAFLGMQKKFEEIIAANPERKFFNATSAGVQIAGAESSQLANIAEEYMNRQLAVQEVMDANVVTAASLLTENFVGECRSILNKLEKMQGLLKKVLQTAETTPAEIKRLGKKRSSIQSFSALPSRLRKQLGKFDSINGALDSMDYINEQILELTYSSLSENDQLREINEQYKKQDGYLSWLQAEIDRINMVNKERNRAVSLYQELLGKLVKHLDAEEKYLEKITAEPKPEDYLGLAELYCDSGDYVLAKRLMQRVSALNIDCSATYILDGKIKAALLDFTGANDSWQKAVRESSQASDTVIPARRQSAGIWIGLAEERYRSPLLPVWLDRIASLLRPKEQFPSEFERLWRKNEEFVNEQLAAGAIERAELKLSHWQALGDHFPESLVLEARCAAAGGDAAAAVNHMEQALELMPDRADWIALLARYLMEVRRFDEGIAQLQRATALDPEEALLWEELGDTLAAASDYAGAVMAFERCYLALPKRIDLIKKMGDCYLAIQQAEAAETAYRMYREKSADGIDSCQNTEIRLQRSE